MQSLRSSARLATGVLAAIGLLALASVAVDLFTNVWAAVALAGALVAVWLIYRLTRTWVPRRTLLEVDFSKGLVEHLPASPLARALAREATPLRDVVDALERAAADRRVVGLIGRIGGAPLGIARAQELSQATVEFAASGKPTVAYAESLAGGADQSLAGLLVASAFGEFYVQPASELAITGIMREKTYLRGLLDKLSIRPQFDHRHEYKAAIYQLTEDHMVEPDREATHAYTESQFDQLIDAIADGRGIEPSAVRRLVDQAPLLSHEAVDAGLVDGLAYPDQIYARLREGWAKGTRRIELSTYLKRAKRPHRRGPTVAIIYGTGAVTAGSSHFEPLTRSPSMGSDDLTAAFRKAIDNKKVKAIVFRIDSPGGSAVASSSIWRATQAAREAGKPVVATMGNVAGSGGYFVAAGCDKIVAQPGTLTGSIGVVSGKFMTRDAWARIGVTFDDVYLGENAPYGSVQTPFTPAGEARLAASLDAVYDDFKEKVAAGRGMSVEAVEEVAKGRVWSGEDAHRLGLVDELGGLRVATDLARAAAGLDPDRAFRTTVIPKVSAAAFFGRDREHEKKVLAAELLEATAPLGAAASHLRAAAGYGVLSMPGVRTQL